MIKLKVRKFWGLNPTFVGVTGEKLIGKNPILNKVSVFLLSYVIIFALADIIMLGIL